jgi:hypothetical protein
MEPYSIIKSNIASSTLWIVQEWWSRVSSKMSRSETHGGTLAARQLRTLAASMVEDISQALMALEEKLFLAFNKVGGVQRFRHYLKRRHGSQVRQ